MSDSPKARKAAWRRQLAAMAQTFTPADRALASQQICARLRSQPVWQEARSLLLFWPMAAEPDIRPLVQEALAAAKLVALPRFLSQEGKYVGCRIRNHTSDVQSGYFGITEPRPECPQVDLNKLDFFLVPGVGFSLNGGRLGRGKGYYDQMLAEARGFKCGVAFDWQVTAAIPLEAHDVCLDCILTPTRWHLVTSARRF